MFGAGKLSETLQQAEVKLIDAESCNLVAYHGEVTEKMLCAGLPQGGVDTCQVGGAGSRKRGWAGLQLSMKQPLSGKSCAPGKRLRAAAVTTSARHAGDWGGPQHPLSRFILHRGTAVGPCCTQAGTGRWWALSAGARAAGPPARLASTPASAPTSTGSTPSGGSVPYCRHRCSDTHGCSVTQVLGGGGEGPGPPWQFCTVGNHTVASGQAAGTGLWATSPLQLCAGAQPAP